MLTLSDERKYRRRREQLADSLREKGISEDKVIRAISRVPRHLFVDPALRSRAYWDEALPIGHGQTISQPFTVAYQTMMLDVQPGDKILEIGTGSGYQSAVLLELGAEVYSIERIQPLYERARQILGSLGYRITGKCGDGTHGWAAFAPYDGIIVTAGATEVPEPLLEQLRISEAGKSGGRLVIPVGTSEGQTMRRITRTGESQFGDEQFHDFRFVPLIGDAQPATRNEGDA
ncbi:MAG: protein-L-isoaspartate(D-aspartate) O-methyltransferase [Rhodothermia bacterium]|nr:protein-L-isoaspartate(D-aspartate) O-methyltransferase [Rhodothermia bacterium]